MRTMTDEVDALAKPSARELRWYAVRPSLLSVLLAEVLTAACLIALEPDGARYWIGRLLRPLTIGVVGIEAAALGLAVVAGVWAAVRAKRGERFQAQRWFRRSEAGELSLSR